MPSGQHVCAHLNLGPHVHEYVKAASVSDAVRAFRWAVEKHYGVLDSSIAEIRGLDEMPCVDLYPACPDGDDLHCTREMNFHGFPWKRFEIGPRGGVQRVMV